MSDFLAKQAKRNEDKQVQEFELGLSMFFAEHNVALQIVDHLIPLLKTIIPDSNIIKKSEFGRKKCTSLVKNVITPHIQKNLVETLKKTSFSVMIDESTDIGLNKAICVLVRYINPTTQVVETELLQLLQLDATNCNAEYLFGRLKTLLQDLDIPFQNVIGMASDGASVMVGANNSVASRVIKENPSAVIIKCVCHTSAIIANKACLTLPRAPEELLRLISAYFSQSSKTVTRNTTVF